MNARRLISRHQGADRRGLAGLGVSAGLHLVVLTLIGLDLATGADRRVFQDPPILVDLDAWPDFARPARPTETAVAETLQSSPSGLAKPNSQPGTEQPPNLPSLRQPLDRPPPRPAPRPASPAAPPAAPIAPPLAPGSSRADAVGRSLILPDAWRGDVCRNPADFAAWQAARCGERPSSARAQTQDPPDAETAIGQRRGDPSERRRDDGFAQQKEMNDRWLEYYRYRDAPYPGLRALRSQL